jgi:hypothetical protein
MPFKEGQSGKVWSREDREPFKEENPHLKVSLIIVKRVGIEPKTEQNAG